MKMITILSAVSALVLFLTSCGTSENKEEETTFTEGMDTVCTVTGYHTLPDTENYFLQEGDKVAVISPSSYPSTEQRDAVMNGLKELGYVPVEGSYTVGDNRTVEDTAADLKWALEDPEIKAIFCIRGGTASSEVLDYMGLEPIKANKKPIIGFSDISTYLSAWAVCGNMSVHATMSGAFTGLSDDCLEVQKHILQGEIPAYQCEGNPHNKQGTADGILIGGNLSVIMTVLSTDYDPFMIKEPYILFIEETNEDMEHIHRYLTVLKHMGVLDKAQGIIFGEWTDISKECESYNGNSRGGTFESIADMIDRQFLKDLEVPVAFGFPAGHSDTHYPLLFGRTVSLDVSADSYTLEWN